MKKMKKLNCPIIGCFLKADGSWIQYRAIINGLAYRLTLSGHKVSEAKRAAAVSHGTMHILKLLASLVDQTYVSKHISLNTFISLV